ncbi:hypothetical protein L2E82_10646 [Cichorium intybus]|uniref:Uncharacterized protein n=1 Tax=Cichorium intybus TaxID=13427 RepID=A0ACB9GB62_CICIN|nr:hypothetical protein L2E82_10646 [Cichorium intybus]
MIQLTATGTRLNQDYTKLDGSQFPGLIHEVFTMVLRGLSGTKPSRPGKFRRCLDGYAVKSSLKAEDGVISLLIDDAHTDFHQTKQNKRKIKIKILIFNHQIPYKKRFSILSTTPRYIHHEPSCIPSS